MEFLIGKYFAKIADQEIDESITILKRQLADHIVAAGDEEVFKTSAKEKGYVEIIDKISARLDVKTDTYLAALPSLHLDNIRIDSKIVHQHGEKVLGGLYAEIVLGFDSTITKENNGNPFWIKDLSEIRLSGYDALNVLVTAREQFTTEQWKKFLIRSIGMEPETMSERHLNALLHRMVPFVERNYNLVEFGPKGTGKGLLFQDICPNAHQISADKASAANIFVNRSTGKNGFVCNYDVLCINEVSGLFKGKSEAINIMKAYMELGEFCRGKEAIRAGCSLVMTENIGESAESQPRTGSLFDLLPSGIRKDTAFMDRIHAFLPGWDVPKISGALLTNHHGMASHFLAEYWSQLRSQSRVGVLEKRVVFGSALSMRDIRAVNKTISGLLKLIYPAQDQYVADEDLEWAIGIALESRRRVKMQQKKIMETDFHDTNFSYVMVKDGVEKLVCLPEM
jgi:ATP-dependent Lon protease